MVSISAVGLSSLRSIARVNTTRKSLTRGIDELRSAAQMAVRSQGRKTLSHIFADSEWVCAEYTAVSHVAGPMDAHNIKIPAGVTKELTLQICFLANIVNGKIVRSHEYWDTGSMMRQPGAQQ